MDDDLDGAPVGADDVAAADRLLEKVRAFVRDELDPDERAMFATLLAPGVAEAHAHDDDDVTGFAVVPGSPPPLTEHLARAVRSSGLRIVFDPS